MWQVFFVTVTCIIALSEGATKLTDNKLINDKNREQAAEVSRKVQDAMKSIRGGTDEFYHDLLEALQIQMCDNEREQTGDTLSPMQRFVHGNSSFAYKSDMGECIKVQEPSFTTQQKYDMGLCEVTANCYWRTISPTDDERIPVYSVSENPEAPQDAMTLAEATFILQDWATGLAVFVAPGIVMSVLTAMTFFLFILCRCFCNRCGGRSARPEGYGFMAKLIPFIIFVLCSAGIAATAGVALLYNETITTSVTGVFDVSSDTLNTTDSWIRAARMPLVKIKDEVLEAVDNISDRLEGTEFIEGGVDKLTSKLDAFGENTAGVTLPRGCVVSNTNGEICIPCEVCSTISEQITTTNNDISEKASGGLSDFEKVRGTLNTDLVSMGDTIKVMVNEQVSSTDILIDSIADSKTSLDEVRDVWDSQDQIREVGVLFMFSLAVIVIALSVAGIILKYTPFKYLGIIHIAYILGFLALIIVFIVAAVMMALSVLLSDTCAITRIMSDDWTPVLGPSAARGLNACFQNESLLEAFNLTSSFEFADELDFPDNGNVGDMFKFTALDQFAGDISGTSATTFDVSLLETYVDTLNEITGMDVTGCNPKDNSYTVELIDTPWDANEEDDPNMSPEDYIRDRYSKTGSNSGNVIACVMPADKCHRGQSPCTWEEVVWEVYSNITALRDVKMDAATFVVNMKTNMTEVTDFIADFQQDVVDLDVSINEIQTSVTANLIGHVNDFKDQMYCTFVAESFDEFYAYMCIDLMPALAMIALSIFLMGIFLIPVNICVIVLAKRLNASKEEKSYGSVVN